MSDDTFIREVNEEIRREQAQAIWTKFGPTMIGAAVLIVLATAAYVAYDYWDTSRANASGDKFSQALKLANDGKSDEAAAVFKELEDSGYGAYPVLARMRTATVLAEKGDKAGAVSAFDAVAADTSIPVSLRDIAKLRAAFLLVDSGSYADVESRVKDLVADTNPLRYTAREALAMSAYKEGKMADAMKAFEQLSGDETTPRNTRERANMMADLIRGSGAAG
jgi:hypothetical protein